MGKLFALLGVACVLLVVVIAAVAAAITTVFSGPGSSTSQPSPAAVADIPGDYLAHYQHAAPLCPGLDWSVLAAIGKIETDHGRLDAPGVHSGESFAGAGVIARSVAA